MGIYAPQIPHCAFEWIEFCTNEGEKKRDVRHNDKGKGNQGLLVPKSGSRRGSSAIITSTEKMIIFSLFSV